MIKIRPARWTDRDVLWNWFNEPLRHLIFGTHAESSFDEHSSRLRDLLKNESVLLLVATVENLRVGVVRADHHGNGDYEIHVYLKPAYCGKGHMVELLRAVTAYLEQSKRPRRLYMTLQSAHPGVLRILQQAGYQVTKLAAGNVLLEHFSNSRELSR